MNEAEVKGKIREYLRTVSEHKPSDDENLFEAGVLDSFGVVEFLTYIEESFEMELEAEDVTLENFSTVGAISAFIVRSNDAGK